MSESSFSTRKKKRRTKKKSKPKNLPPIVTITEKKKNKSRVTKEYEQNEKEVQKLLENTNLSIDINSSNNKAAGEIDETDEVARSVQFFCQVNDAAVLEKLPHGKQNKRSDAKTNDMLNDGFTDSELESELPSDEVSVGKTPSEQMATGQNIKATASTFLQIETDVLTYQKPSIKHNFQEELLYKPSDVLNFNLQVDMEDEHARNLSPNRIRMLNRYFEEAKASDKKVSKSVLQTISEGKGNRAFIEDDFLYHTICYFKFRPIFCEPSPDVVDIPTRKFVKIYIKELRYTQHPQLLEEHRLTNLVEDKYEEYTERLQSKICENIFGQLNTERMIVNELLRQADENADQISLETQENYLHNLEQHLLNVKTLRNKYYEEEAKNKQLLKEILDHWLNLKNERKRQKFQYTRFKLRIRVDEGDHLGTLMKQWKARFDVDLNEIYREELNTYYRAKRLWKQRDKRDVTLTKPEKPDIKKLTNELTEQYAACFHTPGEPNVDIMRDTVRDEEFFVVPANSQHSLKSFFLKIYFDQQFVGETRSYRLEPDLKLIMKEAIGIFLERRLPKDVKIKLYEKSKLAAPRKVATIKIPLPLRQPISEYQSEKLHFTSTKQPFVSGYIVLAFQCDEQLYPSDMIGNLYPPVKEEAVSKITTIKENKSVESEINESTDTSDVENVESENMTKTCTFEEELIQFCSMEEINNNQRFKLLNSRYLQNDLRTKDLRFIPAFEHELEIFCDEPEEPVVDAGNWMNPIDLHKHEGKKHIKIIYEIISNKCNQLNKTMASTESLLVGDAPATWSAFFQALLLLFQPGSAYNAVRNSARIPPTLPLTFEQGQTFKILVNIVRATGIPVRSHTAAFDDDSKPRSNNSTGSSQLLMPPNFKYTNVRPFITLSYRDKLCRTMTAEGSSPTWNEQLVLQLSGSLKDLKDDVKISLFDEVIENYVNDDTVLRSADLYQRIQTNWLGEYRIPITAILANQKLGGVFEINTPKVLLGYKASSLADITSNADTSILIEQFPEIKETVRVWFYLNIEPAFELPNVNTKCMDCSELKEVRQSLQNWCLNVKELKPERFIDPLICTGKGKRVCITRLLEPIPLPIEESENLLNTVCRFVAFLSHLKTYDPCTAWRGVWLNNQVLLNTTWGSVKDLGTLLCNFLLTLGVPSWLVLGFAAPYGESAFVLYRAEDGELMLIDPSTGRRYFTKDVFCPLSKINYIISPDNIYCNLQSESRVTMTNFNLTDTGCWLPAFSKSNPAPLGGVQNLSYTYLKSSDTGELRQNIERKIMKKINSWRTMRKTIWNRAFQIRLQTILEELEHVSTFVSGHYLDSKYNDQLACEFPSYKLYGFTLNFSYVNLTSISDRIKSTGIHLNSDKNVQFSCAVHIHKYPNDVLSAWIFLLSIIPV